MKEGESESKLGCDGATIGPRCPVCDGETEPLDVVDLSKSCLEWVNVTLPKLGFPIAYSLCNRCGFCYSPTMCGWTPEQFSALVYNDRYAEVDPEYMDSRPRANAETLRNLIGPAGHTLRHLDYGGGNGLLSNILFAQGWDSQSYDPFVDRNVELGSLGKFELITAYEVFEHVPDCRTLVRNLANLVADEGIILFSTLLSDGNIVKGERLKWWYAAPRNGHISLFSRDSLYFLGSREDFSFGSLGDNFHAYWKNAPGWAKHLFKAP